MRMLVPYFNTGNLASNLWDEMDRVLDDFNLGRFYSDRDFGPACDISESADHFLMSIDLPGVNKDDLKVEVSDGMLTISGERRRERSADSKDRVHRYERYYGHFKRSFALPNSVESEKVEARYQDGVLELYLPKAQSAKTRKIEIQSGSGGIFSKLLGGKKELKDSDAEKAS